MNLFMKSLLALIVLGGVAATGWYTMRPQDPLRSQLGDDIPGASWLYEDWDKAKSEAQRTGKPIFAYFTRTYSP